MNTQKSNKQLLLDTRWYSQNPTGVGKYVWQTMLAALQMKDVQTSFLGNSDTKHLPSHVHHIPLGGLKKRILQGLWKTLEYPKLETLFGDFSLAHFTNATVIPEQNTPYILTVHDLAWIDFAHTVEPKNLRFLQKYVPSSIENAEHIIAVSDHTKNKIVKHFSIPPQKITTIYNGVDEMFFEDTHTSSPFDTKYFLSCSTIEPRKDFMTQIQAYKKLPLSLRKQYDLVIAGGYGWNCQEVLLEAQKPLDEGNIRLLGYVEGEDIVNLTKHASLYLHTSLDEGFGIGSLQALASKTPVIASHTSCHSEILQEHALYFEVMNSDDLASKIEELVETKNIDREKAYQYVREFSWENTRDKHVKFYNSHL